MFLHLPPSAQKILAKEIDGKEIDAKDISAKDIGTKNFGGKDVAEDIGANDAATMIHYCAIITNTATSQTPTQQSSVIAVNPPPPPLSFSAVPLIYSVPLIFSTARSR